MKHEIGVMLPVTGETDFAARFREAQAMGIPCLLSDCITREADITGHVQYLPITSASVWAVALSAALENGERYDGATAVAQSGYDIVAESKKLLDYYSEVNSK